MISASINTLVIPGANVTMYCPGSSCKFSVNVIRDHLAGYMHLHSIHNTNTIIASYLYGYNLAVVIDIYTNFRITIKSAA